MLGADVVGLQTPMDVRSFLSCCTEFLNLPIDDPRAAVKMPDGRQVVRARLPGQRRAARAAAHHALARSRRRARAPGAADAARDHHSRRPTRPEQEPAVGFLAFARLLECGPTCAAGCAFTRSWSRHGPTWAFIATIATPCTRPSRRSTPASADACGGPPIEVYYTNDRDQALAAMQTCNVLLINSLQDGMNLVAKEWAVVADESRRADRLRDGRRCRGCRRLARC